MQTTDAKDPMVLPPILEESFSNREFGNQLWDVKITLKNHTDYKWTLPSAVAPQLVIESDLLSWPVKGYLTYHNPNDMVETISKETIEEAREGVNHETESSDADAKKIAEAMAESLELSEKFAVNDDIYKFRMDARDEVIIEIKPIDGDNEFPEDIWASRYHFVVYDTRDNDSANLDKKTKTLFFWDMRYQMMLEKNIEFSTATIASVNFNKPVSKLTNTQRSLSTGIALKELLKAANFGDSIDEENWDVGLNTILYTSPANSTVADDVQNILKFHISSNGDKCIFYFNKTLGDFGKWQLISIHDFFAKAGKTSDEPGELQREHFFIQNLNDIEMNKSTSPWKSPYTEKQDTRKDIKIDFYNNIRSYKFVDMAGIDNAKVINNKPVFWSDRRKKIFGVDFKMNNIETAKETFGKLYANELFSATPGNTPILMTLNQTKIKGYNTDPQFTWASRGNGNNALSRSIHGLGKILFGSVFLNECIKFSVLGAMHRYPGTFIAIEKLNIADNTLDNKLCGQWFVTNVKYIMFYGKFATEITAVKIHSYENLKISEAVE